MTLSLCDVHDKHFLIELIARLLQYMQYSMIYVLEEPYHDAVIVFDEV